MPRPTPVSYPETKRDQYSVVRHWTGFQRLSVASVSGSGVCTVKLPRYLSQPARRAAKARLTSAASDQRATAAGIRSTVSVIPSMCTIRALSPGSSATSWQNDPIALPRGEPAPVGEPASTTAAPR